MTKLVQSLFASLIFLFSAASVSAEIAAVDDSNYTFMDSAANVTAIAEAADNGIYTTKNKEFYLNSDEVFFIRPGLNIEILDVVIPADRQLEVTYSLKDPGGLPLDIEGIFTPGPVDMRYMLAHIPFAAEQKIKDTEGSRDEDGTLTALGDGQYKYKFGTILPASYDQDVTYTLALVGRRDLREWDLDRYVANELHHFVPSGLFDPMPRDVVTTETCNGRCHDPLAMHGGRYQEVEVCTQCHNPGLLGRRDGLSKSFDVVVHQVHKELEDGYPAELNECEACHTGGTPTENFPLVASPNPVPVCDKSGNGATELAWGDSDAFEIRLGAADGKLFAASKGAGSTMTGKWVRDGTVFFMVDKASGEIIQRLPVNATVLGCVGNPPGTFRGEAGVQHTNWTDHPSRLVCGSCHEDVDFATGEGHSPYELIQPDDSNCGNCHEPETGTEYDWSIRGAHLPLYKSAQFPGVLVKLIEVSNTSPGDHPTVTFSVGGKAAPIDPVDMNRLRLKLSGPNDDFSFYASEDVGSSAVKVGENWTYTFEAVIPDDAEGSYTVSVEARTLVDIDFGLETSEERNTAENTLLAFPVTDAEAIPRRKVVADYNCESCHSNLAFHGGNRHDPDYCVACHMPEAVTTRSEPAQTYHFKYMIHSLHRGEDLENGFAIGSHDYSDFVFPGDLRNCDNCHVENSQQISGLPEGLLPTFTVQAWWSPMEPAAAACLSCHDGDDAAAHAYANTSFFGESCATCHGEGKDFAVDKVHAR